jgi:hypothetical protein
VTVHIEVSVFVVLEIDVDVVVTVQYSVVLIYWVSFLHDLSSFLPPVS